MGSNSPNKSTKKRMTSRNRHLVEETNLESEVNMPHIPMSLALDQKDLQYNDLGTEDKSGQGLKGDYQSVSLLMFLYVLQGIPLGLGGSIPMLLQSRSVSFKEQAIFSFVFWPFSVKLIWAPIVDSLYWSRFGRRKTWLVPIQYLIGLFMLILSYHIDDYIGMSENDKGTVHIYALTTIFFLLNFLAATQDIAVDGWALTMLSRRNIGWASTCNTVGQTAGYFLGNVLFLALESATFCNTYLRSTPQDTGMVTLAGFLQMWGVVFFVTTTLVWFLKHEDDDLEGDKQGIMDTYKQLFKVIKLPSVLSLVVILLTSKIGFSAADSVTSLKLIEAGMKKETLAMFAIPMVPIQIILPLLISRMTTGPNPMNIFIKAYPFRLVLGLLYMFLVYLAHHVQEKSGEFPVYFYLVLLLTYAIHQVSVCCLFVATMAFHAKISDPAIGGTYMTLLNTLSNLGGNWPSTVALWFVENLTWQECKGAVGNCDTPDTRSACKTAGGSCVISIDGYYIESIMCVVIGFMWLLWKRNTVKRLDNLPLTAWKCSQ